MNNINVLDNTTNEQVYFEHIYNAVILNKFNNIEFKMLEFKIKLKSKSKTEYLFCDVDYKCAWFIMMDDENNKQILNGPFMLNMEKIKMNERFIDDARFDEFNGQEITFIKPNDNNNNKDNIPDWITQYLFTRIYEKY
jgi:hypothetical protein